MPSKKKKFDTAQPPPIDWLWAAVLERQKVFGITSEDLAKIAGVTYGHMRQMVNKSPWSWRCEPRERVCEYFGISISVSPTTDGRVEVNIA